MAFCQNHSARYGPIQTKSTLCATPSACMAAAGPGTRSCFAAWLQRGISVGKKRCRDSSAESRLPNAFRCVRISYRESPFSKHCLQSVNILPTCSLRSAAPGLRSRIERSALPGSRTSGGIGAMRNCMVKVRPPVPLRLVPRDGSRSGSVFWRRQSSPVLRQGFCRSPRRPTIFLHAARLCPPDRYP